MKQLAIRLSWQTTPAKSLVMFERVARVPQPPDQSSNAGYRAAAANRGRLLFGYFFLATQEKVTSCRATPAVLILALYLMLGYAVKLLTQPTPKCWIPAFAGMTC